MWNWKTWWSFTETSQINYDSYWYKLLLIYQWNLAAPSNRTIWWALTFFFTYRQAVHMPILALSCLLSTLSDSIWITATDSLHVNTASGAWLGFWFIPCPSRISPSWLGAADFWRLAEHRGSARILTPATDAWTDTRSPHRHWHEPPSWPSGASRASASQVTPRTRLRDSPPLRPSELASQLLHPPLHLPHQQWVTLWPNWARGMRMLVVRNNDKIRQKCYILSKCPFVSFRLRGTFKESSTTSRCLFCSM